MPFNLLTDPFFPVVTRLGARRWAAFSDLAEVEGDHPVDFDWPRPDLNVAAYEFAIGVATLVLQPSSKNDWFKLWDHPTSPETLRAAAEPYAFAFNLDGDGPRFLQELGGVEGEATPIEQLLIDTPGDNGQKKNADLLTHRARYKGLGLPAAAMALYSLQQFAPSGGAGNRTSMRGGGPMTTLVVPGAPAGEPPPLWRVVLANVVARESNEPDSNDLPQILPWLAPTLISDKAHGERAVNETDGDVHPLQAFFGMPRRVALQFGGEGHCTMTGARGPLVTGFVQKPWGVNYGQWLHPLTPYRRQKEGGEWFSVKPKSARFGYRDWVAATVSDHGDALGRTAPAIHSARRERASALRVQGAEAWLRAGGWAMNNMEAIAFLFAEQPLHLALDKDAQDALDETALRFARAADEVAGLLRLALRHALFAEGAKLSSNSGLFEEARLHFYESTEAAFHDALDDMIRAGSPGSGFDGQKSSERWRSTMARAAEAVFDRAAPIPLDDAERAGRIAAGFRLLGIALKGYGKAGARLFGVLGLPAPEAKAAGRKGGKNG